MKKILFGGALAAATLFAVPALASAHPNNRWLWSEARAELAIEKVGDGAGYDRAECLGTGYRERSSHGRWWLYKHFDCDLYMRDGDYLGSVRLHVLGQSLRRQKLEWVP